MVLSQKLLFLKVELLMLGWSSIGNHAIGVDLKNIELTLASVGYQGEPAVEGDPLLLRLLLCNLLNSLLHVAGRWWWRKVEFNGLNQDGLYIDWSLVL